MDRAGLREFVGRARRQLFEHILPFWSGPALDREQGGWLPWMDNELKVDRRQPRGLIVNSRILWTFSAAFRARPEARYREMAERAFDYLMTRFWDKEAGGAFWRLTSQGAVLEDTKKTYGQAFCIYALAEYHQALGTPAPGSDAANAADRREALARAIEVFELVEAHAHDPEHGGYFEVRKRDWSEAASSRLSEKDMNEKKSMNNHLHVLEAYTNLYRVWPTSRLQKRLEELVQLFEQRILDPRSQHLHHFFDEQWNVRSQTYTFGHDIEASWLLCEAAGVLEDPARLKRIEKLSLKMAETVLREALDADGGLCYEGTAGQVIDRRKECWPQAEAVVGFLNAFELCADERYLAAALRVWEYIEAHLVDWRNGEWFWRINLDGRPDPGLPKVSEWKGPYHGSRACLEVLRRMGQKATHDKSNI